MLPLKNFHTTNGLQAKQHVHEQGDVSDGSEDSFINELSSTERRLHESALASSSRGSVLNDDSISGYDLRCQWIDVNEEVSTLLLSDICHSPSFLILLEN